MEPKHLTPDVIFVGAEDWDRRLFDDLIPLPDGTTYNAYLIRGSEKVALLDTVEPSKEKVLVDNLREFKVDRLDYIVAHHAEQDHSGSLPKILSLYPMAKIVTNPKCKEFILNHVPVPEDKFITISDRETLSLGNKTLEFIYAPWVHWPETMFSYLREDKILFTCDFLGSHFASSELFAGVNPKVYTAAKRYYAEIMMPFRTSIKSNLEKINGLEIKMAAPSHGPVYDRPEFMLNAYKEWIADAVKNEVVIAYASMHGSTAVMVEYLTNALIEKGIVVRPFYLPKTDIGELAMALVDAATVIFGCSTVMAGAHPQVLYAAYITNMLRPKAKYAGIIGSYGWGGKMVEQISGALANLKMEYYEPIIAKGYPKEAEFNALKRLADQIAQKQGRIK